jgi:hypothetical protein
LAGDPGQVPPVAGARRSLWRRTSGPLGLALGVALVVVLVWRIAVAGFVQAPKDPGAVRKMAVTVSKSTTVQQAGESTDGIIRIYNPETGKLVLSLHFGKSVQKGEVFTLEKLELKRVLDDDKGLLLANSTAGVYNRLTGSGRLTGNVLVRRMPPGASEPDMLLRSESLAWDHAAGTLTTPDFAEMTWIDAKTARKLVIAGTDLRAERWAETVRLGRDVRLSMTESALPKLPLTGKGERKPPVDGAAKDKAEDAAKAPPVTVITCAGPATFENRVDLDCRRAVFLREVKAVRGDAQMTCNRLEVLLNPERGRNRDGADIAAVTGAAAAPSPEAVVVRWLARSLAPAPAPAAAVRPSPAQGEGPKAPSEQDLVDSVLATGAVVMTGPEGLARGELAFFDRPGGCVWLDGGPNEPAEVMRGENQLVSQSFHFNLRTEEMSSEGRGRAKVIHKGDAKLPGGK